MVSGPGSGSLIWAKVSKVMYRRQTTHSSDCSARMAPTRRVTAASLGKMPTTLVLRLISLLTRSRGLEEWILVLWSLVSRFRSFNDFSLTFGSFESAQAEAFDGGEDVVGGLGPAEGSWVGVDGVDVVTNRLLEFLCRTMDPAPELFFGQQGEEALDLVQPGSAGRREVDMPARMAGQPASHRRRLVGCVVVHDQMDVEVVGDLGFESAPELKELAAAVTRKALSDDLAGGDVEGGEQRGGAVAHVVMGASLDLSGPHGQHRLGAVERLDLALLVDAEHERARAGRGRDQRCRAPCRQTAGPMTA